MRLKQFFRFFKSLFVKDLKIDKDTGFPLPESNLPSRKKRRTPSPTPEQWSLDKFKVEPRDGKTRFQDFDLPVPIMHAIADLKFKYCTPVQAKLLTHTLMGKDATAQAQTGTGKTASFIISILSAFLNNRIRKRTGYPRSLILAPTRELVCQIEKDFRLIARYSNLKIVSVYGGTGYKKQIKMLLPLRRAASSILRERN